LLLVATQITYDVFPQDTDPKMFPAAELKAY